MAFFVYLLLSSNNSTYVGATVDLERRLRQHNSEIKGGAVATTSKVNKGETWIRACHIEGFPDWQSALQFEWRWKQITRKIALKVHPLHRRMIALKQLLSLERPTTKAKTYSEWAEPPKIVLEDDETKQYYNLINDLNTIS
jgi:structure-specific endonuclease subunit SLX1